MYIDPKCPWCGEELDEDYSLSNVFHCPRCNDLFYKDPDDDEVVHYEPYPDDDYALADFCRGGELTES